MTAAVCSSSGPPCDGFLTPSIGVTEAFVIPNPARSRSSVSLTFRRVLVHERDAPGAGTGTEPGQTSH